MAAYGKTTPIFFIIILILAGFLNSCESVRYVDTETYGIRKVIRGEGEDTSISYEKFDKETARFYEAEKRQDGKWEFTEHGKYLKNINERGLEEGS
jgi:hypothetical protein